MRRLPAWRLPQLRIGPRITLGFGLVLAVLVILALIGTLSQLRATAQFARFSAVAAQTDEIIAIERGVVDLQRRVLAYTYSGYEGIALRVQVLIDILREQIERARAAADDPGQAQWLRRMSAAFERYAENFDAVIKERRQRDRWLASGIIPISRQTGDILSGMFERASQNAAAHLAARIGSARENLLLAHQAALEFEGNPDSGLVRLAGERLDALDADLAALDREIQDPELWEQAQTAQDLVRGYRTALSEMVLATRVYLDLIYVVMAGQAAELGQLAKILKEHTLAQQAEIRGRMTDDSRLTRDITLGISALGVLLAALLAWRIARGITRPLLAMTRTLTDLTHGRLDTAIPYGERTDEIGAMAQAANIFREEVAKKERAEAANRAKSLFLAHMSHELRTPLNAILGFSQLMAQMPDTPPDQQRYLAIINRSGTHLLAMINDILDMSKIEAGRLVADIAAFDLWQLLDEVAALFEMRANQEGLDFMLERAPDLPRVIRTDSGKLRQVLINLLGNAAKFTDEGGICLRAGIAPPDPRGTPGLLFEVEDSGHGIPVDRLPQIFDAFVQVEQVSQGGTGLGLAICRRFVELLGGRITVDSTPGQGSVFSVWLPLETADETAVAPRETEGQVLGLEPGQPAYRLLSVEDNPNNRLLLASILEPLGLELREAANGAEGVAQFTDWHPDLIWMDIRMPVMDGREAVREIRSLPQGDRCKIIALTASSFAEERAQILAAGFDDYLSKPYRAGDIYRLLERHLGLRLRRSRRLTAAGPAAPRSALEVPEEIVTRLRDGLILGDSEEIDAILRGLDAQHPEVAAMLREWIADYQYERVLRWLDDDDT